MNLKIESESGLKVFSIEDIRICGSCYDPNRYLPEDWRGTGVDILKMDKAPFEDRLWVVLHTEITSERVMRLFAIWCARQVQHLMKDPRSLAALDVAERFANGQASEVEMAVARDAAEAAVRDSSRTDALDAARDAALAAAWNAVRDSSQDAARDAARAAAWDSSQDAALDAAGAAAWDSSQDAARDAAWNSAWDAARDAAQAVQRDQLIEMLEAEGRERIEKRKNVVKQER